MTDEPTTQPDASQVALVLSGAFEEAYAALSAAWEAAAQSSPGEVQNALAAADQALQTIAEQVGQQAAVIAGQNEMIETLRQQRDEVVDAYNDLESEIEGRVEEAYAMGHDEAWEDPYALQEFEMSAIEDYKYSILDQADWAADKLRSVGEPELAAQVEDIAKRAVDLRDEAERVIEHANDVAWNKREPFNQLLLESGEGDDDDN